MKRLTITALCLLTSLVACGTSTRPPSTLPAIEKLFTVDSTNADGFSLAGDVVFSQEYTRAAGYTGVLNGYDLTTGQVRLRLLYTDQLPGTREMVVAGDRYGPQEVIAGSGVYVSRYLDDGGAAIRVTSQDGTRVQIVRLPKAKESYFSLQQMTVLGDLLLVPTIHAVYAYSLSELAGFSGTPTPRWQHEFTPPADGSYTVSDVQVDAVTGQTYVLNYVELSRENVRLFLHAYRQDGTEIWQQEVTGPAPLYLGAKMTVGEGRIVVFQGAGRMAAFDSAGTAVWKASSLCQENGDQNSTYAQIQQHTIFFSPGGSSALCAFNLTDGTRKWTFDPNGAGFMNRFVVVRGVLYDSNGTLYALDTATGNVLAKTGVDPSAELGGGTVLYDQPRNQLLVWADKLWAFKPIR
ncbi:PQQ-like beta-propeller repeat protein [Deinococcus sp. KNUC1210]|uniref:outer membrane protein assembly factor BamB family protein n=1 Tax=Deinococcus sp. KNUC1210 TaxID=2917691 RepID=UPI001EF08286|nr:PQQ-binding-like beta-propeller repeat protein [Deinococcus sp. KNUC1210]ULH15523.1 PQQ-like beta-propeller repeat protein [Deinococcus sp. KNUC1210]